MLCASSISDVGVHWAVVWQDLCRCMLHLPVTVPALAPLPDEQVVWGPSMVVMTIVCHERFTAGSQDQTQTQ